MLDVVIPTGADHYLDPLGLQAHRFGVEDPPIARLPVFWHLDPPSASLGLRLYIFIIFYL